MTTAEFRRLHAPQDEADVIAECRQVAERCGVVLELVGQRDARKSGTTLGFPDLAVSVAGWWVPVEAKHEKEPSQAQYLLAVWKREHGVDTGHVRSGQDLADIIGFCRRHPRERLLLPHSLVGYVEAKRKL